MRKLFFFLLLLCDVLFSCVVYSQSVNTELSENLLRLHIIANSDNESDIKVKYEVRDEILKMVDGGKYENKEMVIGEIKSIEDKINDYLGIVGVNYECRIVCTISPFPTKKYNNILMPSGEYSCIKVILGEGRGENWWCVAYPPLCFTESVIGNISKEGETELKERLSAKTYDLIRNTSENEIRFLSVDIVNRLIQYIDGRN